MRLLAILIVTFLSFHAQAQRLLVEDNKGKQRKIPVGAIMTVTASVDSLNANPFHYVNPADTTLVWCAKGCYTLLSVDTISSRIQVQRIDGVMLDYRIADVESVWFVRAKHPVRLRTIRVTLAVLGALVIGQTIATSRDLSAEETLGFSAVGVGLIGYSLLDKRNEPRKYKLVGISN